MSEPRVVTCCVSCARPESFPLVTPEALSRLVQPDVTVSRTVYSASPISSDRDVRTFRVGDYFTEVRTRAVAGMGDPSERRMVALEFHVKPGVSSDWKMVVVEILKAVRSIAPGVRGEFIQGIPAPPPENVC